MVVVLTDKKGNKLGLMEKLNAHQNPGFLHKAISVVLYRKNNGQVEILLQKRSDTKPLWPGYWANTVCTHPKDGESNLDCAVRRLKEEVGIEMKKEDLHEMFTFNYQADYNTELSEHELDVVVVGEYNGEVKPHADEVAEVKWIGLEMLHQDLVQNQEQYAPWPIKIFNNQEIINLLKE